MDYVIHVPFCGIFDMKITVNNNRSIFGHLTVMVFIDSFIHSFILIQAAWPVYTVFVSWVFIYGVQEH